MPTIGRHWPSNKRFDYAVNCDVCGVRWRRSQMRRTRAGRLVCPDDYRGKDEVELAEGNARSAARAAQRTARAATQDGGNFDKGPDETPPALPPLPSGFGRTM